MKIVGISCSLILLSCFSFTTSLFGHQEESPSSVVIEQSYCTKRVKGSDISLGGLEVLNKRKGVIRDFAGSVRGSFRVVVEDLNYKFYETALYGFDGKCIKNGFVKVPIDKQNFTFELVHKNGDMAKLASVLILFSGEGESCQIPLNTYKRNHIENIDSDILDLQCTRYSNTMFVAVDFNLSECSFGYEGLVRYINENEIELRDFIISDLFGYGRKLELEAEFVKMRLFGDGVVKRRLLKLNGKRFQLDQSDLQKHISTRAAFPKNFPFKSLRSISIVDELGTVLCTAPVVQPNKKQKEKFTIHTGFEPVYEI